ncbi:MAG TPA: hypothetical protein DCX27_16190 [Balneola sp.]|jgi:hypothetical protein|nr:hypothetical protein [Balneola sp.]|tara:strand:+ start:195 stop:482 length:288 start_codon:yes stop_codon:yes gene_type:complete
MNNDWIDDNWNNIFSSMALRTSLTEALDWEHEVSDYLFECWSENLLQFPMMEKTMAITLMASYLPEGYDYLSEKLVNWLQMNYRIGEDEQDLAIH